MKTMILNKAKMAVKCSYAYSLRLQGYSFKAIAEMLHIKENTARNRVKMGIRIDDSIPPLYSDFNRNRIINLAILKREKGK